MSEGNRIESVEHIFGFADDMGPEKIVHIHEPRAGLRAIVVIDNTAAGPAVGGTRMAPDVSTQECFRLARAMTCRKGYPTFLGVERNAAQLVLCSGAAAGR
jgi:hypothetical protein